MKNCINRNTKEFKQLLEATKLPSIVLEVKISKWQEDNGVDNFPTSEEILSSGEINYSLKAIEILQSDKAIKTFEKGNKANWTLDKILTELQVPKNQKALLLDLNITDREELALELASNYSYSIKINTSKQKYDYDASEPLYDNEGNIIYNGDNTQYYSNLTVPGGTNYTENEIATPLIKPTIEGHAAFSTENGIGWFRSDDLKQQYNADQLWKIASENQISFEEVRNEFLDSINNSYSTKTRRILELQSDLFQKGRNNKTLVGNSFNDKQEAFKIHKESIVFFKENDKYYRSESSTSLDDFSEITQEEYEKEKQEASELIYLPVGKETNENKFLQLLNKDSNWVTFFIKSIIQDSAKKGYEKVLFPSGNTASKIEGHTTLEEFKREKEDRIKELEDSKPRLEKGKDEYYIWYKDNVTDEEFAERYKTKEEAESSINENLKNINTEINQLKQELERVETEGFDALRPIYNFYENQVQNILKKQGYNPEIIIDEFGNKWNEIILNEDRDTNTFFAREFNNLINEGVDPIFRNNEFDSQIEVQSSFISTNQILFDNQIGNDFTVNQILENISKNVKGITVEGLELIEKSKNLIDKSGAKVRFVSENRLGNAIMMWDSSNNTILISRARLYQYPVKENVISFLHEVAHSTSGKALLNPETFEEKEFKSLIETHFNEYSGKSTSYGFTNPMEFVAELYSNKEFRDEVKEISNKKKDGFWNNLINAIRRLFGLKKNTNFDNLIKTIFDVVESDQRSFRGEMNNGLFSKEDTSVKIPTFTKLEDRLNYLVRKAKDNMDQVYTRTKTSRKSISKKEKKAYLYNITTLIDEMASYTELENWKVVLAYTKSFSKTVHSLEQSLSKKDLGLPGLVDMIYNYEDYLAAYDLLPEIKKVLSNASLRKNELTEDNIQDIKAIKDVIRGFESKHSEIKDLFIESKKDQSISLLSKPEYNTKVETDFRKKLQQEYKDLGITNESSNEYVSRMMNTRDKEAIEDELRASAERLANDPTFDITTMSKTLFDPLNTNSRLIEIVTSILNSVRDNIITKFNDKDFKLGKLFDSFIKEKGNKKPSTLYSNMYEQNKDGDYFLKGKYKIEFRDKYYEEYSPILKQLDELAEQYTNEGLTKKEYRQKEDYKELLEKKKKWLSENTVLDPSNELGLVWLPAPKYLNDELTGIDQQVLNEFRNISKETSKLTGNRNSLIRKIRNNGNGIEFYKLPSITKSDFERRVELDVKGLYKDKISDFKTIKPDDIGYSNEAVNNRGEEIRNVRIHFRGKIDKDQQSLDLFTMYRMEYLNGVNYSEKTKEESNLTLLADVAKNKQYIKKSKRTGKALTNLFNTREKTVLESGEFSNEYARIKGLLESNLYDIMNTHAGSILGVDVNKLTRSVNGITASIAMSFNLASGTANIFNGMTQLFIESLGSQFLSKKSLLNAEKKYTLDLPNILADLSKPTKTSFTNQVLQMFDTFGGFSPAQQAFIKNTITRKLTSRESMNGFNEMGEHMMNSVLTMAVLDNLKVLNKQNKYIDKEGNEVEESKAASLLDMLRKDAQGQLYMDPKVAYTSQNLGVNYFEGGKTHINLLIKKKVHDLFGVYDPNMQNELYKTFYGKSLMMFKRFLISGLQARYKGIGTSNKAKEDLTETDIIYNSALKEYEEGTYTTLIRFFAQGVIPMLKSLSLSYMSDYYNSLTEYEKGNLRKVTTELFFTMVMLPALAIMLNAAAGDDDDELMFWIYEFRRLDSELSQFRNPIEASRLISNPVAGSRLIQNGLSFIYEVISPINFIPEDNENVFSYLDEDSKGKNILVKKAKKLIPIWSQLDKNYEQMHNFINKN